MSDDEVEIRDLVSSLFDIMPRSEREILEMRFFYNMKYHEICGQYGVSAGYLRHALSRILDECRRVVKYLDLCKTVGDIRFEPVITEKSLLYLHSKKKRGKLLKKREERKKLTEAIPRTPSGFLEYCLKHYRDSWKYRVENGLYVHPFFKEWYYMNKEKFA